MVLSSSLLDDFARHCGFGVAVSVLPLQALPLAGVELERWVPVW